MKILATLKSLFESQSSLDLITANTRLQLALEAAKMVDWDFDYEKNTAHRTIEHDRLYGYDHLLPHWNFEDFFRHVLPEYHQLAQDKFQNIPEDNLIAFDYAIKTVDGRIRWIELKGKAHRDSAGKVQRIAGVLRDITEEKVNQDRLKTQLSNLEILFEKSPEFFCVFNSKLVYEYVNPAHVKLFNGRNMTGLSAQEAQPEISQSFIDELKDVMRTKTPITYNSVPAQLGDRIRYLDMIYAPKLNEKGQVDGITVLGQDVTDKIQALQNAETSRLELQQLFTQAPFPICLITGEELNFTLANPEYEKFVGRKVRGLTIAEAFKGEDVSLYEDYILKTFRTGEPQYIKDAPLDLFDESNKLVRRYINVGYHPYLSPSGAVTGVLIIILDVSEQVRSILMRDEFIRVASHELKTPLTGLKLQMQVNQKLLAKQGMDAFDFEKLNKLFSTGASQVGRLTRLVEDMLEGSSKGETKLSIQMVDVNLSELVIRTFEQHKQELAQSGITLNLEVEPGIVLAIDDLRVEQVLINLITNAIKYAANSSLLVNLSRTEGKVELKVKDQGPGIASKDIEKIFDRFQRVNSNPDVPGFGLGLYLSREIMKALGGEIKAKSFPGQGSEFTLEFNERVKN